MPDSHSEQYKFVTAEEFEQLRTEDLPAHPKNYLVISRESKAYTATINSNLYSLRSKSGQCHQYSALTQEYLSSLASRNAPLSEFALVYLVDAPDELKKIDDNMLRIYFFFFVMNAYKKVWEPE